MKRSPLFIIFLTVFIDLLGFGIVIPVLPAFAQQQFHADASTIGMLIGTFSFMQMVFTPIIGRLSDRLGRKPVIIVSLIGSAASYVLLGFAGSIAMLFIARAMAGIGAGSISSAQAYVADITTPHTRTKGMGMIGAAFSLGFVFGPALGGVLAHYYGPSMPAFFAAALSAVAGLFAIYALPESLPKERRLTGAAGPIFHWKNIANALRTPVAGPLFIMFFFLTFAIANIYGTFTLLCLDDFKMTVAENGYLFGYMGLVGAIIQGGIHTVAKRFHENRMLIVGSIVMATGLLLFAFVHTVPGLLVSLTFLSVGNGINTPTLLAMISKTASQSTQGSTLGVNQALGSLGRVAGPMWGDYSYQYMGHGAPFLTGGVVMLCVTAGSAVLSGRIPAESK